MILLDTTKEHKKEAPERSKRVLHWKSHAQFSSQGGHASQSHVVLVDILPPGSCFYMQNLVQSSS